MRSSGVYKITNTANNKIYIGSAVNIHKRFMGHKAALRGSKHQNKHLQSAWNKYQEFSFKFETILICGKDQIRFYEQLVMDNLNPEYNQSTSAYSGIPVGGICTKEHKGKISAASKAHWLNPDIRKKNIEAIRNSMTDEERKKRSERSKQLWANPEYRAKAIAVRKGHAWNKGYKCTETQVANRKKAARISNMKRNYGSEWKQEYIRRYPEHVRDIDAF